MAVHLAAIPAALLVKLALGAGATIGGIYVVTLSITVVRNGARKISPHREVLVRREHAREQGRDYIRIAIEASGKQAAWLTEKIDQVLLELLPHDGATAKI